MTIVLYGLAALLGVCALINLMMVLSVLKLRRADELLEVIPGGHEGAPYNAHEATAAAWAEANDFEPDLAADFHGALGPNPVRIRVWKSRYRKTFLVAYTAEKVTYWEFVTNLREGAGLTTSNTRDSVFLPSPPGFYVQAFHGADLDAIFERHESGLIHLHERFHLTIVDRAESTAAQIVEAIARQVAHVRAIPFWQFRGVWWYVVRRSVLNGKGVADQFPG